MTFLFLLVGSEPMGVLIISHELQHQHLHNKTTGAIGLSAMSLEFPRLARFGTPLHSRVPPWGWGGNGSPLAMFFPLFYSGGFSTAQHIAQILQVSAVHPTNVASKYVSADTSLTHPPCLRDDVVGVGNRRNLSSGPLCWYSES